ncbi:serine/threonine protein phosphatase PP2A regulatory subunit B-56 Par2 [Schizosaccharomyces osmophilus]|uniref:Serine/threonine-protein phosphatase 2A 56 kDa regulatory subunit n=1 Tax=Schizosaccharomyces osmophilus TaxID=2545709 RepID=A0AAE9W9K0_9SCHI|nr:serine/threonine protein phosphatase PP2A regulatory subunit B-56 Par2 [Schizosaccharomyces osmophilus]WBW71307.1 serine/threonine protein phosphatase PP2A regulatory subunit B-56 Par2 [Schizosaccharomyces osmophilus]
MKGLRNKFVKALSFKDEARSDKDVNDLKKDETKNAAPKENQSSSRLKHSRSRKEMKKSKSSNALSKANKSSLSREAADEKTNSGGNNDKEDAVNAQPKTVSSQSDVDEQTLGSLKPASISLPDLNLATEIHVTSDHSNAGSYTSFHPTPYLSPSASTSSNKLLSPVPDNDVDLPNNVRRMVFHRQHSSQFQVSEKRNLTRLPSFDEVHPSECEQLFIKKLDQCNVIFDFNDPSSDLESKDLKSEALAQMIDLVTFNRGIVNTLLFSHVLHTFSVNLFRPTPSFAYNDYRDILVSLEEEPYLEPAWPHMQQVYLLFIRFLESPDFKVTKSKSLVDRCFFNNLLMLFNSEDPRERDLLKTALHRIYGKFLNLRSHIRKAMSNVFLQFTFEKESFHGIAELLEILGSIINGFAVPLKEEHKTFLTKVLIPLHQTKSLFLYHPQLTYCVVQFIDKEPSLTKLVMTGILKFWPRVNSFKEVMFLNELEDIFEVLEPSEFVHIQIPLFQQLSRSIASPHFQVAERALCFWSNEYFTSLVSENLDTILPIIYPYVYNTTKDHWNITIQAIACNVMQIFVDMNLEYFNVVAERCHNEIVLEKAKREDSNLRWAALEKLAAMNKGSTRY